MKDEPSPRDIARRVITMKDEAARVSEGARCWAEIDCSALRHNARVVREMVGPAMVIMAIVKADGYGHGLIPAAHELAAGGEIKRFGVANLDEAVRLRGALPESDITVLSPALPGERREIVRQGFLPWISSIEEATDYARAAQESLPRNGPFAVEIKVDTGMGRMGVPEGEFGAFLRALRALPALRLTGIVTHLPSPDEETSEAQAFTRAQLERFAALASNLPASDAPLTSQAQNSAGLMAFPAAASNAVRPGLMLYGSSPIPSFQARLRPVLALKTRVTLVRTLPAHHGVSYGRTFVTPRPMRVATLAAGYGDGYPRRLSNSGADVLIRGRRCPVLGRVTMDQIMVGAGHLEPPELVPGEEVVLIGRQGGEEVLAAEVAEKAGTIAWEIFTGLTARARRCYFNRADEDSAQREDAPERRAAGFSNAGLITL